MQNITTRVGPNYVSMYEYVRTYVSMYIKDEEYNNNINNDDAEMKNIGRVVG